jgi:hypothetical protein
MLRRDESFVPSSKFRVSLRAKGVACVSVRDGLLMSTQMSETVYNACRQFQVQWAEISFSSSLFPLGHAIAIF